MSLNRILETVDSLDHVLTLAPDEESGLPEIAWGDYFFYYSPDGLIPDNTQPFATVITKDYPDDTDSDLDPPDRFRLNIHVGRERFIEMTGESPRDFGRRDFSEPDAITPHPVYGALGWIAIVNPGEQTMSTAEELLRAAHGDAKRRAERAAAR